MATVQNKIQRKQRQQQRQQQQQQQQQHQHQKAFYHINLILDNKKKGAMFIIFDQQPLVNGARSTLCPIDCNNQSKCVICEATKSKHTRTPKALISGSNPQRNAIASTSSRSAQHGIH